MDEPEQSSDETYQGRIAYANQTKLDRLDQTR